MRGRECLCTTVAEKGQGGGEGRGKEEGGGERSTEEEGGEA